MTTTTETLRNPTSVLLDLAPAMTYILIEASKRPDIKIYSVSMSQDGIDIFTGDAGSRQHLANALGLPSSVITSIAGSRSRVGRLAGSNVRVFGGER